MTITAKNTSWSQIVFGIAIIAFYTACLFGWMIKNNNAELANYKKEGIETTAKVVSKSRTREGSKKVLTNHLQGKLFDWEPGHRRLCSSDHRNNEVRDR